MQLESKGDNYRVQIISVRVMHPNYLFHLTSSGFKPKEVVNYIISRPPLSRIAIIIMYEIVWAIYSICQYIPWHDLSLLGLKICMSICQKCLFWCWLYFFLLNDSYTQKYLFIINWNKEKTCRKKYSSFKNNIKPSRKATTFYCICIIHVYSSKNVFMVVHVYSCL